MSTVRRINRNTMRVAATATLAVVNVPKNFSIDIGSNLPSGAKLFLLESSLDPDEGGCDADGARIMGILKMGDQSGTTVSLADSGAIGGSIADIRREAANIFRTQKQHAYQPTGDYREIPIVDSKGKITLTVYQNGAAAVLGSIGYEIIARAYW